MKKKLIWIAVAIFMIGTTSRMLYLNLRYPGFKKEVYPMNKTVKVMGDSYCVTGGKLKNRNDLEVLKRNVDPGFVSVQFRIKTTDKKAMGSDYFLFIDGELYQITYGASQQISSTEYELYYSFPKKVLQHKIKETYLVLPKVDNDKRIHPVVKVKLRK